MLEYNKLKYLKEKKNKKPIKKKDSKSKLRIFMANKKINSMDRYIDKDKTNISQICKSSKRFISHCLIKKVCFTFLSNKTYL